MTMTAVLGLLIYEVVSTLLGVAGLKLLFGQGNSKYLLGIKQKKTLPVVDGYVKQQVGRVAKHEDWLSRKAVHIIQTATQYESFRMLLIIAGRHANANGKRNG